MKKILVLTLACISSYSGSVAAENTARFEGMITNQTCSVTVDGKPGSVTVQLPSVPYTALSHYGSFTGLTKFSIAVSGCSYQGTYVSTRFVGNNVNNLGALNNLNAPEYAKNVAIVVGSSPTRFFYLSDFTTTEPFDSITLNGSGTTRYGSKDYYAQYLAMAPVTPGKVLASMQYAIVYP